MSSKESSSIPELQDEQRIALRRAARNGEYNLLLGAGASRNSKSTKGMPLPNSQDLSAMLHTHFDVRFEEGDQLWRIYDRCIAKAGQEVVYKWFREHFWNVSHPDWMELYARSPWNAVWTLNVDDTFQSAHRAVSTENSPKLKSMNWDDPFVQSRDLDVIHLHGILDSEKPRNLVFSLSEYAGSASVPAAWPRVFHDVYGTSPFVIIGARLRDEPDLEYIVAKRNPAHPAPSFYVSQTITEGTREDLLNWGLIPVEMTAEDFAFEWSELTGLDLQRELGTETELGLRIGQQFSFLNGPKPFQPHVSHDFLGGDQPHWNDIKDGRAAELQWISAAISDCKQIGRSLPQSTAIIYTGKRLTGRSTGLLSIGHFLSQRSWRILYFENKGRLDCDALLSYAADGKSLALLFDGVTEVSTDINRLISEARKSNLNIVCIGVDQSYYDPNIISRIDPSHLAHQRIGPINTRLKKIDAARLVDMLDKVGRLGILESQSDSSRLKHFTGEPLFDSMAALEQAPGFGLRIKTMVDGIRDEKMLKIIFIASFASKVDRKLLVIDAARMVGLRSEDLIRLVEENHNLESMLSTNGTTLSTRQRWRALNEIINRFGEMKSADILKEAIQNISPRLNTESLHERNPSMMLVGAFMSHKNLQDIFPETNLDHWYDSLIDVFGSWSGRYWEQRAITLRRDPQNDPALLAKAESFALRATNLVPDTYSFTTLGTVLMKKASHTSFPAETFYNRGFKAFETAGDLERRDNNLITWIAFLRSSTEVLERISLEYSNSQGSAEHLLSLWSRISDDCNHAYQDLVLGKPSSEQVTSELKGLSRKLQLLQKPKDKLS